MNERRPVAGSILEVIANWAEKDARLSPVRFECRFYEMCNKSANGALANGQGCCMTYVGPDYDKSFRVALVGMDHGEFYSANVHERLTCIQDGYVNMRKGFNPHYAGVVKTAAAIIGNRGRECLPQCSKACRGAEAKDCVLKCIAQPNLVKCVPDTQDSMASRATRTMRINCAHHLLDELRILHPKLVVFHGKASRLVVPAEFSKCGVDLIAVPECSDRSGPVLYQAPTEAMHLLFLLHPSRGWLNRQWPDIERWVGWLRTNQLVPA